jgi:hypothetical protein
MEKYSSFEKALMEKIHYRCIDVPCCHTCAHGEDFDEDVILCRVNRYYTPDLDEKAYWFGDHLGLCDKYKKNLKKENSNKNEK